MVWDITKKFTFNTWGSYVFADGTGSNNPGTSTTSTNGTFTSWMAALSVKDLFTEGDLAAIMFGQPLFATSLTSTTTGVGANTADLKTTTFQTNTPYHLEALYRFRVSKNISITPGVFFVFNQGSNSANGTATVGVIRTTFSF